MKSETAARDVHQELTRRFPDVPFIEQTTADELETIWVPDVEIVRVLRFLRDEVERPYEMLFDLTAIDERERSHRENQPDSDFTIVYHLMSFSRNSDVRLKVSLTGDYPVAASATSVYPSANWYEREVWDLFGVKFRGHPHLRRILMPNTWQGHPLRKEHPARATEMGPFALPDERQEREQEALHFNPAEWGLSEHGQDTDYMFLNMGPSHPGTHGLLRIVLQLDGEEIRNCVPEIGFHHRGAEKMAERQSFHTFIPYTDRIDYLGGVMNNFAYVLAVEKLAGIEVPDRAKVVRIMLAEFFRISSHLVWYGTFVQDIGQMSPVFHMFTDRERLFQVIQAITGGRMHPSWFRIGGVAQDLPKGWDRLVREFLDYMPKRLREYDSVVLKNAIFRARTKNVGPYTTKQAMDWGVTGAGLRATGFDWDFRKKRPYGGYDQFEFDIPTGKNGDSLDRALVRVEEIRQSLRIIEQCLKNMPEGDYKSSHPLTTPPRKERTMKDIETLIDHFLGVTWGPVMPSGEAAFPIEATKGANSYYVISDEDTNAYRTRIRTPSFAHMQMLPEICRGSLVPDLIVILGSIDYVLADIDR